jgi:hypothetical protein
LISGPSGPDANADRTRTLSPVGIGYRQINNNCQEEGMPLLFTSVALAVVEVPLLNILLTLIVVGVLLWLINRFIPMQGTIKSILNAVVVIVVVLWLLQTFGLFNSLSTIHVGH